MEEVKGKPLTKEQEHFLEVLAQSGGNVSVAVQNSKIKSRTTYYNWLQNPVFAAEVDNVNETAIDYVESKLMGLISQDNPTAIIFYLKTKGKNRGYVERIENSVSLNPFEELMKSLPEDDE